MINDMRNKKKGDGKLSSQMQIAEEVIEALELLHKAAREEKEEVKKLIRQNVLELAELLAVNSEHIRDEVKETVSQLDEKLHENPWPYIAATAVGAFFIGQFMKNK